MTTQIGSITHQEFFEAAKELTGKGEALVAPSLYLCRHALELALKDVLDTVLVAEFDVLIRDELFGAGSSQWSRVDEDWNKLNGSHDLADLLQRSKTALGTLGAGSLPPEFTELVTLIDQVEDGAPDGLRYSRVRSRAPGGAKGSFVQSTALGKSVDVTRIERLMCQVVEHLRYERSKSPPAFYETLALDSWAKQVALFEAVCELERVTKDGTVRWTSKVGSMELLERSPWGELTYRPQEYLEVNYQGRTFALARLPDDEWGENYALAPLKGQSRRRFAGLTEATRSWHNSNLPQAAEKSAGTALKPYS